MLEKVEITQEEMERARFRNLQVCILQAAERRGVLEHQEIAGFLEENAAELRGFIEDLVDRGFINDEIIEAGVIYIKTHMPAEP